MGSNDERLLDVRGFGGTRDECAKDFLTNGAAEFRSVGTGQLLVGLVHVVDDLVGWNDEGQVLRDEVDDSVAKAVVGDPDGSIFGDAKVAGQNGEVKGFQFVRIGDG